MTTAADSVPVTRALVVDDDPVQRLIATSLLRDLGVPTIVQASDGLEALALVRDSESQFQITLCDLDMPGMDGVEFLSQLGAEQPGSAVVVLSSMDAPLIAAVQTMASSNGLRVLGAMQKPLSRSRLRTFLSSARGYPPPEEPRYTEDLFTVEDLREGIEDRQFIPFFQPKIDLNTGMVKGAEALMRWRHPRYGMVAPGRFIPLAESTGLIVPMTWSMLDAVMERMTAWTPMGIDFAISINITIGFLEELAVTENISAMATKYGLPSSRIILEITESMATSDLVAVLGNLVRLRMRGFGLSIDDFGTGYASMQQLSRIPFSELKVDRSFVAGAAEQEHVRAILHSSVQLGKRLGLMTIAEGVETAEELALVRSIGCDQAQGYFFAKPMDPVAFVRWIDAWRRDTAKPAETALARSGELAGSIS